LIWKYNEIKETIVDLEILCDRFVYCIIFMFFFPRNVSLRRQCGCAALSNGSTTLKVKVLVVSLNQLCVSVSFLSEKKRFR
jgi:hypothetical protein